MKLTQKVVLLCRVCRMTWIRACTKPFWVNDGQADICYKQSRLLLSFSFYTVEKITLSTSARSRLSELCLNLLPNFTYAALMECSVWRRCCRSGYLTVFFFCSTSVIVVQRRHLSLTLLAHRPQQPNTMVFSRTVLLQCYENPMKLSLKTQESIFQDPEYQAPEYLTS